MMNEMYTLMIAYGIGAVLAAVVIGVMVLWVRR
jgi:hypothetical protein